MNMGADKRNEIYTRATPGIALRRLAAIGLRQQPLDMQQGMCAIVGHVDDLTQEDRLTRVVFAKQLATDQIRPIVFVGCCWRKFGTRHPYRMCLQGQGLITVGQALHLRHQMGTVLAHLKNGHAMKIACVRALWSRRFQPPLCGMQKCGVVGGVCVNT